MSATTSSPKRTIEVVLPAEARDAVVTVRFADVSPCTSVDATPGGPQNPTEPPPIASSAFNPDAFVVNNSLYLHVDVRRELRDFGALADGKRRAVLIEAKRLLEFSREHLKRWLHAEPPKDWLEEKGLRDDFDRLTHIDQRFWKVYLKAMHSIDLISAQEEQIEYKEGVVVVPLKRDNSHDYSLNRPYQCLDGDHFYNWASCSTAGNRMTKTPKSIRLPYLEEIIAMLVARGEF